ncbi:MAG: arginine--tRNA ligase [Deltaproteobacteria bacterium]|jgi:arginyl-tRNA synthetase|nr:arginine--tRNA ligase [Deltaproteobacteria bacterium]
MKELIRSLVWQALQELVLKIPLDLALDPQRFTVERPANSSFGDFSANAAMVYFKAFKAKDKSLTPQILAGLIIENIPNRKAFSEINIAGAGFINFRLTNEKWQDVLLEIRSLGDSYGSEAPKDQAILLEFVSSNPTGPLHVGHGRGAAWGDAMGNILSFLGHKVEREYYINDAGNQIDTLGASVIFRLKNPDPEALVPDGLYKGLYVLDIANELKKKHDNEFFQKPDEEIKSTLSREASEIILADMQKDLEHFGVHFDKWFSEKSLYESGKVQDAIDTLKRKGHTYEEDGALYFRSTQFGDDKDRVLIKSNGDTTYFASDVAYHDDKFKRGFQLLIDVLGADHGGYLARMRAGVAALGYDPARLELVLYQLVKLYRNRELLKMSTRAGEFVPLKLVLDEVSPDAARFLYLTQSHDSTLDFDLEVAKAKNNDNPSYYVQYLTARIFQLRKKAQDVFGELEAPDFSLLVEAEEMALISKLSSFPELLQTIGAKLQPHLLTLWLIDTARLFHHYYGEHRIVQQDKRPLSLARLELAWTVREVVKIGLTLLGAMAPDKM